MFEKGKMACDGVVLDIPPKMTIPQDQETFNRAFKYYENKEWRLYICLEYPGECK